MSNDTKTKEEIKKIQEKIRPYKTGKSYIEYIKEAGARSDSYKRYYNYLKRKKKLFYYDGRRHKKQD